MRAIHTAVSMPILGRMSKTEKQKKNPTYIYNVLQYMARLTYIKFYKLHFAQRIWSKNAF